jgi:hypothetical protein
MFLFSRKPQSKKPIRRRPPLRLRAERLESRACPSAVSVSFEAMTADAQNVSVSGTVYGSESSYQIALSGPVSANLTADASGNFSYYGPASSLGTITANVTDTDGDSATGTADIYDPGPQITMLSADAGGPGKAVDVSGGVSAGAPGGLTVTFSGSAGLADTSTTTDAYGNFNLATTASQLGDVTATVTDVWGITSSPMTVSIECMPPQVTSLMVEATGQGKQVTVQGNVSASSPGGLKVSFSGSAGLTATSATTDSNGNFNLTTTAAQLGEVDATVTDVWGQVSPLASATLTVMPPQIEGFGAIELGNGFWEFEGTVQGPDAGDDSVQLSGMNSTSATPDSGGNFSVTVYLGDNPSGVEYAVATDIWGQSSQQVSYSFFG